MEKALTSMLESLLGLPFGDAMVVAIAFGVLLGVWWAALESREPPQQTTNKASQQTRRGPR